MQAVHRWTKASEHGISPEDKGILRRLFQVLLRSPSEVNRLGTVMTGGTIVWSKKTWIGGFSKITLKGAAGDLQNLVYSESLPQCGP